MVSWFGVGGGWLDLELVIYSFILLLFSIEIDIRICIILYPDLVVHHNVE